MFVRRLRNVVLPALGAAALWAMVACAFGCKSPAASEEGPRLFASACARCHGSDGAGGLPLFDGGPSPRNFHDRAFQRERTDEQLKQTIVDGKGVGMPPFRSIFTDVQLVALVTYVRSLGSK